MAKSGSGNFLAESQPAPPKLTEAAAKENRPAIPPVVRVADQ
jgi:hypothetical protein